MFEKFIVWVRNLILNPSLVTLRLQALKLDLDYKGEQIVSLNKELEELRIGGGASEEEVSALKRQKHDLEMRLKDQVETQMSLAVDFSHG